MTHILAAFAMFVLSSMPAKEGAHVFPVDVGDDAPLPVHIYAPEGAQSDAPIILVMHGANRNADTYRDNWIAISRACGIIIAAPEFSSTRFPGSANYNLGGLGSPVAGPVAFDMVEPVFEAVRAAYAPETPNYTLFGHSAGAQFVHRFVLFRPAPHLTHAVAANAGWYTVPTSEADWPYGLRGAPEPLSDHGGGPAPAIEIHLGERDNDPNGRLLRRTPEAMAQGAHRQARGVHMAQAAGWPVTIVPGADHNNALMAPRAARSLLRPEIRSRPACRVALGERED